MRTALGWRHRIWVKELWAAETDDDDAQAREVAPEVAKRILALADQIGGLGRLAVELRDIADRFEDIPHIGKDGVMAWSMQSDPHSGRMG